jgi:alpha-beta hydrolase superfamily lysophospholipase
VLFVPAAFVVTLAIAPGVSAAPPTPAGPRFSVDPPVVQASPDLLWNFHFVILNTLDMGLYVDSVTCVMSDKDRGETHAERTRRLRVPAAGQGVEAVSAGDSVDFSYGAPAIFESGTFSFQLHAHRGDGTRYVVTAEARGEPGPVSTDHPSQSLTVDGRKVEIVTFRSQLEGPAPGLLLVHGEGTHARALLGQAQLLAARGYSVALVSQPGFGLSDGPVDRSGARTIAALSAALDALKRTPGVDSTRLAAWGISSGAGAVATLATRRTDLVAVVLQSGSYDLWATYRAAKLPAAREAIVSEAGRDSSAWRERSPLLKAGTIQASVLVLHGELDPEAPVEPAKAFAAVAPKSESRFVARGSHQLSRSEVNRAAFPFLAGKLGVQ